MKLNNVIFRVFPLFIMGAFLLPGCGHDTPIEEQVDFEITTLTSDEKLEIQTILNSQIEVEDHSILLKDCEIEDNINSRTWLYNVILPKNYSDQKSYPLLYLLHGKDSDKDKWLNPLKAKETLDYFYSMGLEDLIVIIPNAENTYYVDNYQDDIKYESFFRNIFMPEVERLYNFSSNGVKRFISGFSMGGWGALYYALKYADDFDFCYAMSAPVDGKNDPLTPSILSLPGLFDLDIIPSLHFDIGNSDGFVKLNLEYHFALNLLKIPHEIILREGGHDTDFWTEALYLMFKRIMEGGN